MISVDFRKNMGRAIAEQSNALSISWLNKKGLLPKKGGWRDGTVTWTHGWSESKSSIGIYVVIGQGNQPSYIKLTYTHTSHWTDEKSDMEFRISLTMTPCNLGGVRYWFICPLTKNGRYCGRRVGVVYAIGKWFGCRHCGDIAYQAQFEGGNFRVGSVTEPVVEEAYNEIMRFYYKGRPTRRYKRYLRLREKMDNSWIKAAAKFGGKF